VEALAGMRGVLGKRRPGRKRRLPLFSVAFGVSIASLINSVWLVEMIVNAEFCKKALEKVGNPNVLVNVASRRVRQLNSGAGGLGRPLVADAQNLSSSDIALREIIEEKIGWEVPEPVEFDRPAPKKRRRH
jgi:DNA-directed RNA polymerase subunit omega